jgi:hypothetical protein
MVTELVESKLIDVTVILVPSPFTLAVAFSFS